jgi:SsrA-binding protein
MSDSIKLVANNKKARYLYEILETWEAGIVLNGSEVKSLRAGKVNFIDSFAKVEGNEAWILNLHISPYEKASYFNHEALRKRKLLLHVKEIRKLQFKLEAKGLSIIPLKIYFRRGYAKIELALARGKKLYDKRESIAERDSQRRMEKASKEKY